MILNKKAMENIAVIKRSGNKTDNRVRTNLKVEKHASKKTRTSPAIDDLIAEGGENFFHYLKRLGLDEGQNMMVLPSSHHYYYDYSELEGVTTLVNMKKLNMIKHLDSFLQTVSNGLSPKTNFIGCFSDINNQKDNSLTSRIYKRFINFLDSKTDLEIDKNDVSRLFESRGYKVIDMTEINGLTYFRTQNLGQSA
jgi:hypothetical protein